MTQGDYDLKPTEKKPAKPKPGEPGWVEPVPVVEKADEPGEDQAAEPPPFDPEDVEKNKAMAILAYVCFVIPLLAAPQSKFARYHTNQGLLEFIFWCVAVVGTLVLEFGWMILSRILGEILLLWAFFGCIFHVVQVALLVGAVALTIVGIIHAANGEKKGLPLIGHWTLIQ